MDWRTFWMAGAKTVGLLVAVLVIGNYPETLLLIGFAGVWFLFYKTMK